MKKIVIIIIFLFISGFGFIGASVKQPIEFNHKKHKDQGVECDTCHIYVKEQSFAKIPDIAICLGCHSDPITDSKEEEKIREYNKKGMEIKWIKLYNLPDNVYFSHRRHVTIAKLDCKNCHGNMGETTKPPKKALVKLNMNDCIRCHKNRKAKIDCIYCHK